MGPREGDAGWAVPGGAHPMLAALDGVEAAVADLAGFDPGYLSTEEKADVLLRLTRLVTKVTGAQLKAIAASDDVAAATGATDVARYLTANARVHRAGARRLQKLAHALDTRWRDVAAGVHEGAVNLDQAAVIVPALTDLAKAAGVGRDVVAKAETQLVEFAAEFGPDDLKRLADRILEIVAPEIAEEIERKRLEAEDKRAVRKTQLTTTGLGESMTRVRIDLPDAASDRLLTYLEAFTQPRKTHPLDFSGTRFWDLPYSQQLGHAFLQLLENYDPDLLPMHGGDATTLVVTIPYENLITGLGAATLPTGTRITAGEARRLACTAGIIPAVLGSKSEPLDLGRSARLFSPAQRKALAIRQSECAADGCSVPSTWCHAHHVAPWKEGQTEHGGGGKTNLSNGILLCGHHHRLVHRPEYTHQINSSGWRFSSRT